MNDATVYEHEHYGDRLTGRELDPSGAGYVPTHWRRVSPYGPTICPHDGNDVTVDRTVWQYLHCDGCGNRWTLDGTPVGGIGERVLTPGQLNSTIREGV